MVKTHFTLHCLSVRQLAHIGIMEAPLQPVEPTPLSQLFTPAALLHIKTPQLIGIVAGCVVFTITIAVVIYLLVASGTLQRAIEEIQTGKPIENKEKKSRPDEIENVPELYEHLLKASVTLPSVPAVPELQSTKIVVRPMKDTDVPNLVAASDGSALFGESSYDPLRIWRWLPDANIAAELHGGQHPSDSEEIFAKVFPSCPQTGADFIHLAIVDRIVKKPIGMLSVVDNNVKNLSARIGWYFLRCFA
jgi:hypothetical protein